MRSVAVATLGALMLLVVCTVVPWWFNRLSGDSATAAKPGSQPAASPEAKPPEPRPAEPPAPPPADDVTPSPADAEKAIKVMGLDDTKVADPKKNPLEDTLDNLLDKIE
jgi:hypothetical protein